MLLGFYYLDPTIILVLIGLLISALASWNINRTYKKYAKYQAHCGLTATQTCRIILDRAGLENVQIERVSGDLTDHYDPTSKTLRLSDTVAHSKSIAAIGVSAHECGHAVQDQKNYVFMRIREKLIPVVNFGSNLAFPIIFLGLILGYNQKLIDLGIFLFSFTLLFQLVTLPVEFNASHRALVILEDSKLLTEDEIPYARSTLRAAALTYVASALASFLSLLRLILLFGQRDDN